MDIIKLLLQKKAKLNAKDRQGNTPLHLAVCANQYDVVDFLCKHAEVHARNSEGHTPLHMASLKANIRLDLMAILIKNQAEITDAMIRNAATHELKVFLNKAKPQPIVLHRN